MNSRGWLCLRMYSRTSANAEGWWVHPCAFLRVYMITRNSPFSSASVTTAQELSVWQVGAFVMQSPDQ